MRHPATRPPTSYRAALACVVYLCTVGLGPAWAAYLSPIDLIANQAGDTLYIAEATAKQIAVFDTHAASVTREIPLPDAPTGLALSSDEALLYVTSDSPAGKVHVVDLAGGAVIGVLPAGHTSMSPVLSPDGQTLYVSNRFRNDVSVIDLITGTESTRVPVAREPVAAVLTPGGTQLLVANHLPAGPATATHVSAVVSVIETATATVTDSIQLPDGASSLRDICLSPDGLYAYVPHILANHRLPTNQIERGWINANALSVIDVAAHTLLNTVLLDDLDLGAGNPWGVACTADGRWLCVTHAGTHEISAIDRPELHARLTAAEDAGTAADVPGNLAFLRTIRRRLPLAGNGPRGLTLIGTTTYATEFFTGTLGSIDIDPAAWPVAQSIVLGAESAPDVVRQGEMNFNDATFCFQNWQSCATCHPDVRADGLNWDLLNDGIGNVKNAKSLLLAHETPPVMVTGIRADAETAVRAGLRYIQFIDRPDADAAAIDEYLKSLEPVQSPYLLNGERSAGARRGSELFEEAQCGACHSGDYYTDLQKYDVGTGTGVEDNNRLFDTPTLIEAWRTAPYLSNGRAATIQDVLTTCNPADEHGVTSDLSPEEIDDLAEYILSIGPNSEQRAGRILVY